MRTPLLKGKVRRNTVRIYENSSVKIDSSLHVDTTRRLSYRLFRECCSRCSHTKKFNVSKNFKTRFLCSLQSGNLWTTTITYLHKLTSLHGVNSAHLKILLMTFLSLWLATDHEPHCRHVPININ